MGGGRPERSRQEVESPDKTKYRQGELQRENGTDYEGHNKGRTQGNGD